MNVFKPWHSRGKVQRSDYRKMLMLGDGLDAGLGRVREHAAIDISVGFGQIYAACSPSSEPKDDLRTNDGSVVRSTFATAEADHESKRNGEQDDARDNAVVYDQPSPEGANN
jgi:hypothetical protein